MNPFQFGRSSIHGFGLFASKRLRKGRVIDVYYLDLLPVSHGFNHVCANPNVKIARDESNAQVIIVLRNVQAGQELNVSYASAGCLSKLNNRTVVDKTHYCNCKDCSHV